MADIYLYLLLVVAFYLYHYKFFTFSKFVLDLNDKMVLAFIVTSIINLSFWVLYAYSPFFGNEAIASIIFLMLLLFEYKFFFKTNTLYALFLSLAFTINTISKRMMVFAAFSLYFQLDLATVLSDRTFHFLAVSISFLLSLSTISLSRKKLNRIHLDTILTDKQNLAFARNLLLVLLVMMSFFNVIVLGIPFELTSIIYHYFVVGATALLAFAMVIIYAYFLAELRLHAEDFKRLSKENLQQQELIKVLEEEASTDFLTGLNTRELADNLIKTYVLEKEKFFICFMDMDNLKYANDTFGHDEGDFYIRTTAKILNDTFAGELVCRYGGDEFAIIGTYTNQDDIVLKTVKCFNKVFNIQKKYSKPYETSISYGTVFVPSSNGLSAEKLIAIADQRMYSFKKENKKHRTK